MSRRFGRNQKRAMRAEIDAKGAAVKDLERRLDAVIANQRPMRETIDNVARALGKHFIGLPPITQAVNRLADSHRIPTLKRTFDTIMPLVDDDMARSMVDLAVHELDVHRFDSRAPCQTLGGDMHIYLRTNQGQIAYAISDTALASMDAKRLTGIYVPMIAEAFARAVVQRAEEHTL